MLTAKAVTATAWLALDAIGIEFDARLLEFEFINENDCINRVRWELHH